MVERDNRPANVTLIGSRGVAFQGFEHPGIAGITNWGGVGDQHRSTTTTPPPEAPFDSGLITDGGFADPDTSGVFWVPSRGYETVTFDSIDAIFGAYSLRVLCTGDNAGEGVVDQEDFAVTEGDTLTVSFYSRSTVDATLRVDVFWPDSVGPSLVGNPTVGAVSALYTGTIDVPSGATVARLSIRTDVGDPQAVTFWLDYVKATAA